MTTAAEEGDGPETDEGLMASTKRLAEWTFSLQGVGADLRGVVADFKQWARTTMAHWADSETPPPDPERDRRSLEEMLAAAARIGAQRASVEIRSQHTEGGKNDGDSSWKDKIVLPLVIAGIVGAGAAVTYEKVSSLEMKIDEYIKLDQQKILLEHRSPS